MSRSPTIAAALRDVRERIAEAALRAGRDPADVRLVAVTKTFPAEVIVEAYAAGQRNFGENRPEEGAEKIPRVVGRLLSQVRRPGPDDAFAPSVDPPVWHMIGHIQSRKADLVVSHFNVVHSVDRLKLAERLNQLALRAGRKIPVMLECNVSGEPSKYGYAVANWETVSAVREVVRAEVAAVVGLPGLRVEGLMTVAPVSGDREATRKVFASLRGLRDFLHEQFPELGWPELSMGMTGDFEIAVSEGATLVRIGRAIFGSRV